VIDSLKLAGRLRAVVAPKGATSDARSPEGSASRLGPGSSQISTVGASSREPLEDVLCGSWREHPSGRSFVVERRVEADAQHGRVRVRELAAQLDRAASQAPMLSAGAPARVPFVFIDLETTGLSGGAGTYAFLVGCGSFTHDGAFLTRQYLLPAFADERPMLETVADELTRAGAIVTFNGKSFDAPVLETRYLFHRLEWAGARLPHIDVLHPSRRFWRDDVSSCTLVALERQVLGARRTGDVYGFEIPARYFQFIRSGDARPLAVVLEHNRLDLLSLAGLTARLLHLLARGPGEAGDSREAFALGQTYARAGFFSHAIEAYRRAMTIHAPSRLGSSLQVEILRSLALAYRRGRRFHEAAIAWRQLLDTPGCAGPIAREATEALAIHHEHRARDLAIAKTFALKSLDDHARPRWNDAVRHRLARIERKMTLEERTDLLPMSAVW